MWKIYQKRRCGEDNVILPLFSVDDVGYTCIKCENQSKDNILLKSKI